MLLPVPGLPSMSVVRPSGRPPYNISSRPDMYEAALANSRTVLCFLRELLSIPAFLTDEFDVLDTIWLSMDET
jgi:hypothetical protein